jgi:Ca2+-binding EF-hand superfamily protein
MSIEEFVRYLLDEQPIGQFEQFDTNGDKSITPDEVMGNLTTDGYEFDSAGIREIIDKADTDKNGSLNAEEADNLDQSEIKARINRYAASKSYKQE